MKPPIHHRFFCGLGTIPVSHHDMRTRNENLTRLTGGGITTVRGHNTGLGKEEGTPRGAGLLDRIFSRNQTSGPTGFSETVDLLDLHAQIKIGLNQVDGNRSGSTHDPPQSAEIMLLGVEHRQHKLQHGRNHERRGDLFLPDQFPGLPRIKSLHDDQSRPCIHAA